MKVFVGILIALVLSLGAGCAGVGTTKFIHPEFDFSYIETIAVVPLENLSDDQGAGARATRYLLGELLAAEAFLVKEPGEVTSALASEGLIRTGELTTQQAVNLGQALGVQGLFLGSVNESAEIRSGSRSVAVVSVVLRLVETETGATVWSATNNSDSSTFWSSVFGTVQQAPSEVLRSSLKQCLETLLD